MCLSHVILKIEKNNRKQHVNQTHGKGQSTAPAPLPPSTTVGALPLCVQCGMRMEGVKRGGSMQTVFACSLPSCCVLPTCPHPGWHPPVRQVC